MLSFGTIREQKISLANAFLKEKNDFREFSALSVTFWRALYEIEREPIELCSR
jgi:hypothetical protein